MGADSDIIKYSDLIEKNAVSNLAVEFDKVIPVIESSIKQMAANLTKSLGGISFAGMDLNGLKKINDELKQTNELAIISERLKKAEAQATAATLQTKQAEIKLNTEVIKQMHAEEKVAQEEIKTNTILEKQKQEEIKTTKTQLEADKTKLLAEKEQENVRKAKAQADKAELELSKKKADAVKKEKDAYGQLSSELTKLKREAKNLGAELIALEKAGKKNTSEYKALSVQYIIAKNNAAALDKQLKSLDGSVGDNQRNVGNYKQSIKDAARELGLFGGTAGKVVSIIQIWIQTLRTAKGATEENAVATNAAEAATGRWGRALNVVKLSIKALGIGALIAVLGSIAASFKTTEKGFIQFESAMEAMGDIIKIFIGRLGQFGSGLIAFFPAIFKDISNGITNLKNELAEFLGGDSQPKLSTNNVVESLNKMKNAFVGMGDEFAKAKGLADELVKLRLQNRKDNLIDAEIIRKYASEVAKLNEIAQDQTVSFAKREQAAKEALAALKESSEAEIRIKQRAVVEAQKELEKRKKQTELTLDEQEKLSAALDALDDARTKGALLKLQIEEKERTTLILKLQNQIQLIEQTFDKEKELRDKEISDLEKTFAERQKLANNLDALSKEKYEKEIGRIADATKKIIDANELIAISDDGLLSSTIKSLELGNKAEDFLLKAIINRKAEIKSVIEQNKTINKDIIKDLKEQQQVQHDIANEQIRTIEINLNRELKLAEDNLRKQAAIAEKVRALNEKKLRGTATNEIKKVTDDKVLSEDLKAKKILLIDEKLKNDLLENENNYTDKLQAIHKKQIDEVFKTVNQITDGISEGLRQRSELQQQADQRDIDYHKRIIDVQAKLAAAGQDNILAEEQARADKAEEKKLQDAKKAAKQQENITIIKTFADTLQAALQTDKPFLQAFAEATAASGLVAAAFAKLFSGTAFKGTEDTGEPGKLDNKGGMAWIVHPHERIIKEEHNEQLDGITNEQLVKIVTEHKKKTSDKKNEKNIVNEKHISSDSKNKTAEKNISNLKTSDKNKSSETIRVTEKDLTGIVRSLVNESALNEKNVSRENISSEKTKTSEVEKKKITDIIVNNFKDVFSEENTQNISNEKNIQKIESKKSESATASKTDLTSIKNITAADTNEKVKSEIENTKTNLIAEQNITRENVFNTFLKFLSGSDIPNTGAAGSLSPDEIKKTNKEATVLLKELNENKSYFENIYTPQFNASNVSSTVVKENSHDAQMTNVLRNEIRELKKAIESKPVANSNLGRLGEWTETVQNNGLKNIIHHKKQNSRRSLRLNG